MTIPCVNPNRSLDFGFKATVSCIKADTQPLTYLRLLPAYQTSVSGKDPHLQFHVRQKRG